MADNRKIAVVGATGHVGRTILQLLAQKGFSPDRIIPVASDKSQGRQISYGEDHVLRVSALSSFSFKGISFALFSPGGKVSAHYAPQAAQEGCVVIDNTSHFRMEPDVPLVIPEINGHALSAYPKKIISNPNCSTIQLLMAVAPLHALSPIKRIVASTYQSVSGAGHQAMETLLQETKAFFMGGKKESSLFTKPIAFNVIPHIDMFLETGETKEERKMVQETQKILAPTIQVSSTCVRVPVLIGHGVAAHVEFISPLPVEKAKQALTQAPGVILVDEPEKSLYATPIDVAGKNGVYVSRLRADTSVPHGLSLWIVSDNLRKGAALNAVQILEMLLGSSC